MDQNVQVTMKNFPLTKVEPLTNTQQEAFESWAQGLHLVLHGVAGTGKTFLALYFAFQSVLNPRNDHEKVYIIRSAVPTRQVGFMPGKQWEKDQVYEEAYYSICSQLFGRGDAYEVMKMKHVVEFRSTSFLRGLTLDNCVLVVDEIQNMNDGELHTVMTRVGENTRVIFSGDIKQDDLTSKRYNETSGLKDFMTIMQNMSSVDLIEFTVDDIVRSDLVKEYIIVRDHLGL